MINRRGFIAALAGVPFIGSLAPKPLFGAGCSREEIAAQFEAESIRATTDIDRIYLASNGHTWCYNQRTGELLEIL